MIKWDEYSLFISLSEYVHGTYTYMLLNVCQQAEVRSLTWAITSINALWVGMRHGILIMIN